LAVLAVFMARCLFDCSNCNWPSCLANVADILKTFKSLVAASKSEIWHLPLLHMLP
jgi:hypothetical protein